MGQCQIPVIPNLVVAATAMVVAVALVVKAVVAAALAVAVLRGQDTGVIVVAAGPLVVVAGQVAKTLAPATPASRSEYQPLRI